MNMLTPRSKAAQIALATLLIYACVALATNAQAQTGRYRIAGKVVSSTSGAPLAQARVTIASVEDRSATISVITGDDGVFAFANVPAGKYSLEGARRGFITSGYDAHENFSTAIVTGGEADSEHLIFRLTPQAVLTGHVFDEAGDPVRKASVSLYRQDQSTGVGLTRRIASARTDDRGVYEFAELPAGNYFISVNARPWYALHPRSSRNGGGTATTTNSDGTVTTVREEETITTSVVPPSFDVTYATTYYPDTTDSDEATPIPLRGGEHLTADVHLSPVPALRILLRMDQQPGRGFAMPQLFKKSFDSTENVTVQLMAPNSDVTGERPASTFTMLGDGEMEFSGIPAGKYTVRVPALPGSEQSGSVGEFDINQNGQEVNPSAGEPASGAKFTVRVLGTARPPQGLMLALRTREHRVVRAAPVDSHGACEMLDLPPGKYDLLAATPINDYAVTRITINGSPSRGHTLDVVAGATVEGTVTLIGGQTVVQGIAKRDGKGVPGAMIVMVPKDPEANGELFRRDQSDLDGTFSLGTVIPGEYTVVAIENGWDLNWSQPGVIAHYAETGQKVVVAPTAGEPVRLSEPVEVQPR
ncbi:MAG TPA: carboxypeptidase-like regulatory domain-containing protein [Candidatus Eisenbacteria bacterium]|nr:carboxypeptidase-like regulatory domain-containing protein [Candidatus Eisenbacteria bacterium]